MSKNKGISLIALVVTIIVLMILAGISIQMLRGDTGIINQTHNANKTKNASEEKEAVEWAAAQATGDEENKTGILISGEGKTLIDKYLKQYIGNETNSSDQFEYTIYEPGENVEGENVKLTKDEFVVKFKETENIYVIDQNGVVHKDETSGNNNNKNNGSGSNQGGSNNGQQGDGNNNQNEEIAKRDGVILSKDSIEVNNETTNTIEITTNASNLKITNSDDSVIELTEKTDEKITFVSKKIGRSTITVETEKGKKARCYVLVHQEPKKLTLDTTEITFDLSENNNQHQVTATIDPSTTNHSTVITWTSSNSNVAEVSSSGNPNGQLRSMATIKAKSNGTATITAKTENGKTATCQVTVHTSPTKITLNKNNILLDISGLNARKEETLKVTYTPSTSDIKKKITWTSSNTNVATVDPSGGISDTATINSKASGKTTITAKTENGFLAQCEVVVQSSITKITLSKTSATLDLAEVEAGKNLQLTATIEPRNVTEGYTWSSSNTRVATVSSNGYVSGKTDGTTTITVKSSSGKRVATCTITVKTSIRVTSTPQNHYTTTAGYTYTYSECTEQAQRCEPNCEQWAEKCYTFINDAFGQLQCTLSGTECTHYGCTYITYCANSVSHEEWVDGSGKITFNLNISVDTKKLKAVWSGASGIYGYVSKSGSGYSISMTNYTSGYPRGTMTLRYVDGSVSKDLYSWSVN